MSNSLFDLGILPQIAKDFKIAGFLQKKKRGFYTPLHRRLCISLRRLRYRCHH
jgi:hypothetical protein